MNYFAEKTRSFQEYFTKAFLFALFSDVTHCDGLAWDWVNKRLYWTDTGDNTVNRLSRDGYSKEVLFHEGADEPRAIVLMPCDGKDSITIGIVIFATPLHFEF